MLQKLSVAEGEMIQFKNYNKLQLLTNFIDSL